MMTQEAKTLQIKLTEKKAIVGIVGLGYVGLPLALAYANAGIEVLGFDLDLSKISAIASGKSYIKHVDSAGLKKVVDQGFFKATDDFKKIQSVSAIILCLPTPLNQYREPDLSFVEQTMTAIMPHLQAGQVVSLESTTYPGTTRELIADRIAQETKLIPGESIFVLYSPEREDPGNPDFTTESIPKVIAGLTPNCLEVGLALYGNVIKHLVSVSSLEASEMTKLLENIHRSVNIGLVNEMKIVADRMGINIFEVIKAAATKPFGFKAYYPGPGIGGHCIPIDPFYLTWKAREFDVPIKFIELAGEINQAMPLWVIDRVTHGLNLKQKAVNGSRVLVLGLAYKKDIDDVRESPSVHLMKILEEKGAQVDYYDPYVPSFPKMRDFKFDLDSVALDEATLAQFDCVLIATDHSSVDYDWLQKHCSLIVDSRGVYSHQVFENVIRA